MKNQSELCKARSLFISRGILNENVITKQIMHSWVRSKLHHISFEILNKTSVESTLDFNHLKVEASRIMNDLRYMKFDYSGVYLIDLSGTVLFKKVAERIDIPQIKSFSEEIIGTTAAGLCLHSHEASIVYGCEHFNQEFIHYISQALPIKGPRGEMDYLILVLSPIRYETAHFKLFEDLSKHFDSKAEEPNLLDNAEHDFGGVEVNLEVVNPINNENPPVDYKSELDSFSNECKGFTLKEIEKDTIIKALDYFNWNILKSSQALGIGRSTLYRKLKEHNIKQEKGI